MYRFFAPIDEINDHFSINDPAELHHMAHVLRLKKGEAVQFFNGRSQAGEGVIEEISMQNCRIKVTRLFGEIPRALHVILACAMPKKSKFETIIEKATELGVQEIIPLATQRTEVILKGERAQKKRQRFETVALNAAKQSKRADIPRIHDITNFKDCIDALHKDTLLVMPGLVEPRVDIAALFPLKEKTAKLAVLIGPEGDFTPEEYAYAKDKGARIVSLGPTTLKVETAALAAASFILLHYPS